MSQMFWFAKEFNQPIGNWTVSQAVGVTSATMDEQTDGGDGKNKKTQKHEFQMKRCIIIISD